jgi:hypothetical protein
LNTKLAAFAARSEVKGVIVDVASFSRVGVLKQQAANNPACPFAKNLVAEEIKSIVDSYRLNPLQYVVLVGNDDAIPFFRSPDQSGLGQESASCHLYQALAVRSEPATVPCAEPTDTALKLGDAIKDRCHCLGRHQRRRAAAEENAADVPSLRQ